MLTAGTKLGPYEIVSALGAGGMGEVYRARDTRLDRTVAIKILHPHFALRDDARQRFEREARTISQLNHPHICTLYDVGQDDEGNEFLVLEHLEGETLEARLERRPLPPEDVLKIGIEICAALEKAHRLGIVHRDLKPANVMLTKDGAKLMDFGLAKYNASAVPVAVVLSQIVTEGDKITSDGMIVGTFQYMAPEQLEGKEADARTDIFATGTVLYEGATGRTAFTGKTKASLIASILSSDPPAMSQLAPLSPPALERTVKTCLAKNPDDRFQTAHDLLLQLRWIAEGGSQAGMAPAVSRRRKLQFKAAWAIASLSMAALLAIGAAQLLRPAPAQPSAVRSFLPPPKDWTYGPWQLAISPDGSKMAFRGWQGSAGAVWIQSLATTSVTSSRPGQMRPPLL